MSVPGRPGAGFANSPWEGAKWMAVACMALNHVGLMWASPWQDCAFIAGRVSLPVFSLLVVYHLRHETEAKASRYLLRLLIWALVAQPIYAMLFSFGAWGRLNALATLASGVCLIYLADRLGPVAAAMGAWLVYEQGGWLEGGAWMPLGQLVAWYALRYSARAWPLCVWWIAVLAFGMNWQAMDGVTPMAWAAVVLTSLAMGVSPGISSRLPRLPGWLFYAFYPCHLAVILWLKSSWG